MTSTSLNCRFCGTPLHTTFVDLGVSPLANSFVSADQLEQPETFYPLHTRVCESCFLVQLPAVETPEAIFSDYAYFSSFSDSWLEHARQLAESATRRFGLGAQSRVVEVASNDGYLLRFFRQLDIPVLGIEPARNVARAAEKLGIPTLTEFFGTAVAKRLAAEGQTADLLIGNNVLAHTPHLNDFVAGLALLLAPRGVVSLEFPHLLRLIEENQFDTIYHEHFSYFSFLTVLRILGASGLEVFDVEELSTHGGSLRILARHREGEHPQGAEGPPSPNVEDLLRRERAAGLDTLAPYRAFGERVRETKHKLLDFLLRQKSKGRRIVGYGAPAKGNTLLNYCGIRSDFLAYTVDRSPHKQGGYLPGTRIPIHDPEHLLKDQPDLVLILPWNLRREISEQMAAVRGWGGQFVVAIPEVRVLE